MIDFRATFDDKSRVLFCNENSEVVKIYSMCELEKYVIENKLNLSYCRHGIDALHFNKFTQNHIAETSEEIEVWQPVSEYIDQHWFEVTEKFYLSNNPTEHKANNTPQKTLRQVG